MVSYYRFTRQFVLLFLYIHNHAAIGFHIEKVSNKSSRYPDQYSPYTWIICACRPGCVWMKITRNLQNSWNLLKVASPLLVWWKRRRTDLQTGLHFFRLVLFRHSLWKSWMKGTSEGHQVQPPTWSRTVAMGWISHGVGNLKRWRSHSWAGDQLQCCITSYWEGFL